VESGMGIPLNDRYWEMYSIVIQLGAILALPIYFWRRILKFVSTFPRGESGTRNIITHPLSLTIIAFIVTAIPSWLLTKKISEHLDNLLVIGSAMFVGGIVMGAVDIVFGEPSRKPGHIPVAVGSGVPNVMAPAEAPDVAYENKLDDQIGEKRTNRMEDMTLWQAIWIGACQILSAVFPGTSRSMATIAAGQIAGMSRPSALEFSFFLSIPTMVVATGYTFLKATGVLKSRKGDAFVPLHIDGQGYIVLAIGFLISFVVALGVVAWFMNWVRRRGFLPFAAYRIVVGIAVLAWVLSHG